MRKAGMPTAQLDRDDWGYVIDAIDEKVDQLAAARKRALDGFGKQPWDQGDENYFAVMLAVRDDLLNQLYPGKGSDRDETPLFQNG